MTLAETRALLANAGRNKCDGLRFDLIHSSAIDDRWTEQAVRAPAAFVRALYRDGFQNEGDPTGWPFGAQDEYLATTVDGEAVIVGYGPDPDGVLTFAAYVILEPDATRWTLEREGEPTRYFDTYGEAFAVANGSEAVPFQIIPPLTEL